MEIDWNEWFYYDESSPSYLRWKVDRYRGQGKGNLLVSKGDAAGWLTEAGYWCLEFDSKGYKVHRIIWESLNGPIPDGMVIDHMDGDRANNTVRNLRVVTRAINTRNAKLCRTNKTGVAGVQLGCGSRGGPYYLAVWKVNGKKRTKCFSIARHGEDEAFRLACDHRARMIAELNGQGAGYSARHGT